MYLFLQNLSNHKNHLWRITLSLCVATTKVIGLYFSTWFCNESGSFVCAITFDIQIDAPSKSKHLFFQKNYSKKVSTLLFLCKKFNHVFTFLFITIAQQFPIDASDATISMWVIIIQFANAATYWCFTLSAFFNTFSKIKKIQAILI